MLPHALKKWFGLQVRNRRSKQQRQRTASRVRPRLEPLEDRTLPSITITTIPDQTIPATQDKLLVNVAASDSDNGTLNYTGLAANAGYFAAQTYQLHFGGGLYQNYGGQQEKWLQGTANQFGNPWYFVKPDGELWAWDSTANAATGAQLVTLEPVFYERPDMLYNAQPQYLAQAIDSSLSLDFTGNLYRNYFGQQEEWLFGTLNRYRNQWYFLKPDGELWAWDGTPHATGTRLATLDSVYYTEPQRLYLAPPNMITVSASGSTLTIDPVTSFEGSFDVQATVTNGSATATAQFKVTVVNHAPVVNAIADQVMPSSPRQVAVNVTATDADGDTLTYSAVAGNLGYVVKQTYNLTYTGNLSQNYGGQQEKWLIGVTNQFGSPWYFIKPNGELWAWDGTASAATGARLATLDPVFYQHPDMLYNAQPQSLAYALDQGLGLTFTGNFSLNYFGQQEKWLQGATNQFGNPWYFIKPNGELWAWDGGSGTGARLATLDTAYYAEPQRLYDAQANQFFVATAGSTLTATADSGFKGSFYVLARVSDGITTTTQQFKVAANPSGTNNPPAGTDHTITLMDETPYQLMTADFGFSDNGDNPPNHLLAVKIDTVSGAGTLTDNGVAVTAGQFVSAADITAGLLVFTPGANAIGNGYAGFTFQVQDDGSTAFDGNNLDPLPRSMTINVHRALTVTVDAGQGKVYGDTDPTLTFQITSGALVGSDSFSGALSRVAGENVGTYAITQGTLTAGSDYDITFVSADFTISKRAVTLTVAADPGQGKVYGDADPTLTYQITSGSLVGSDSLSGSLSRATGEDVGAYAITQGTLSAGSNYDLTLNFVSADFTISARPITVTVNAGQGKTYGDADPILTYQITSGSLAFSDAFTGTLARNTGEDVGTHAITQGTLALSSNYDLSFVGADFTISARRITVTVDGGQGKVYGDADPTLTYQLTSGALVGSDSLSGALSRDPGEDVGTYAITQGTLTAGSNYDITFVGADFTISKRAVTLTVEADAGQGKTYGDADPMLTYRITSGALVGSDSLSGALSRDPGEDVGTHAITAGTLTAGSNYDLTLNFVSADFTISARPITVTVDGGQGKTYGDADPSLTYQITSGSLAFSDAFSGTLKRDPGEDVGTHGITQGTLALNSNYDLSFVGADFTISKRQVTVMADAGQGKTYGDADPTLTYQLTSGSLAFSDAFSGTLTRDPGEDVGTYAITQGTLALSSNYDLSFVGSEFTISQRPITVTADPGQGKVVGDPDPTLTFQLTSGALAAGDSFSGALSREPGEDAGTYAILVGTLTAGANYDLTFVSAGFTISPAI
jgi:hypothetical protein